MSDDGADFGVKAERALETVLGGKESPRKEDGMTPEQMREYLLTAPDNPETYDDTARALGKIMLTYLEAHPEDADLPLSDEKTYPYYPDDPERSIREATLIQEGLYDKIKRVDPKAGRQMSDLSPSGFQAGWAVNAAKYALGQPSVPNPAIMTVSSERTP